MARYWEQKVKTAAVCCFCPAPDAREKHSYGNLKFIRKAEGNGYLRLRFLVIPSVAGCFYYTIFHLK